MPGLSKQYINRVMYLVLVIVLGVLFAGVTTANVLADPAAPGCYKIENGKPKAINCPSISDATYVDEKGAIIQRANDKCYVFSENLYGDATSSYGEPYVQVDCSSLASCNDGQELQYNNDKLGKPSCAAAAMTATTATATSTTSAVDSTLATDKTCDGSTQDQLKACYAGNPLVARFNTLINVLSIAVGFIVVIMVIVGGIQYSTAGSNPQAVAAARKKIFNAVISLVALLLVYSFMQWITPGGIF